MNELKDFKPGDVVVLKGGSTPKTVERVFEHTGEVCLAWFADRELCRANLPPACLDKVESFREAHPQDEHLDFWRTRLGGEATIDYAKDFGAAVALAVGRCVLGGAVALLCHTRQQYADAHVQLVRAQDSTLRPGSLRIYMIDDKPAGFSFGVLVVAPAPLSS